jgi:hemolysin activation/secretion protein
MKHWLLVFVFGCVGFGAQVTSARANCLNIKTISIQGAKAVSAKQMHRLVSEFEGRCIGLSDFDTILERITLAYVDKGLILARAYLPEQDLSGGQLAVAVVEGELSQITFNGAENASWAAQIFPNQIGRPVQLRAVEQGLDQIKSMPRWQAEMVFDAGQEPGDSILAVQAKTDKPSELTFSTHNRGSAQSGQWVSGLSYNTTNLLGMNESLTIGGTHSLNPGPISLGYQGDANRSMNAALDVPFGRHNISLSQAYSDYHLTIKGAISPIATNGLTRDTTLRIKSLLHRDKTTKTHLSFDLARSENQNWIAGALINASSRTLSTLRTTLSHERPMAGGDLSFSIWNERGLTFFGAETAQDRPANSPNAQFVRSGITANFKRDYTAAWGKASWASTVSAQYSDDLLYGGQQFSVGGAASVRGSLTALATGSSGATWRNEMEFSPDAWRLMGDGAIKPYLAMDIGTARPHASLSASEVSAAGAVIGLRVKGKTYDFDASWQEIQSVSWGASKPAGIAVMSLNIAF